MYKRRFFFLEMLSTLQKENRKLKERIEKLEKQLKESQRRQKSPPEKKMISKPTLKSLENHFC
jgi:cell division septum initiation protein DivIVA